MYHLTLLGPIDLRDRDNRPVEGLLRQPKRLALLAYLAMPHPGSWHRRDILLATFWPELDTSRARTSLRNTLYVLRTHLGEVAIRSRGDEEVSLDPARVVTDVAELREALGRGDFSRAATLWRGELLDGLHPPEAGGFEPWLDAERQRLRREVRGAWEQRADEREAAGAVDDALLAVEQLLAIDPIDEPSVRRVMRLLAARGNAAGALAAYEGFCRRLQLDLDGVPTAETAALAERLRLPGPRPAARRTPAPIEPTPTGTVPPVLEPPAEGGRRSPRWVVAGGMVGASALLLVFGALSSGDAAPALGVSRPVTVDEGLQIEPSLAPNGRLVAFAKGDAQRMRIFITRLDGSATWPLTTDSTSIELLPRWSPESDEILFLARDQAWLSPAVGGQARRVAVGAAGEGAVRSASWSPRGDSVLIVRGDSLLVVPRDGPGARLVGRGTQLHSCVWSPDGRWIACVSGNWVAFVPGTLFGNRAPSALVLYPAAGGDPIHLTDAEHEHQSPAWSSDGRFLWFLSDRDGVPGEVHRARIGRRGRFEGALQRLGLTAEFLSVAAEGLVYSVPSRRSNIHVLDVPREGVASVAAAVALTRGNQVVEVVDASSDGQWLAFDSDLRGRADLHRIPLAGGPMERLTDDPRPEFAATLSPDGDQVAFHRWEDGLRRVRIRRLRDGEVIEPLSSPGDHGVPRWSPRGDALAIWRHDAEPGSILVVRRDAAGRWFPPRWVLDGAQLPVWSPEGDSLAFLSLHGDVRVMSADSGAIRAWYSPRPGSDDPLATFLSWRGPGRRLWFLGHRPSGMSGIWELRPQSAVPRLVADLRDPRGRTPGPSLTSDGRRWYFTLDERASNLRWVALEP